MPQLNNPNQMKVSRIYIHCISQLSNPNNYENTKEIYPHIYKNNPNHYGSSKGIDSILQICKMDKDILLIKIFQIFCNSVTYF